MAAIYLPNKDHTGSVVLAYGSVVATRNAHRFWELLANYLETKRMPHVFTHACIDKIMFYTIEIGCQCNYYDYAVGNNISTISMQ